MSIGGLAKLINGIVLFVLGVGIIITSKSLAKGCREEKIKIFGEAKYDDISEVIARALLILIGIVFVLGSFLHIYRYLSGN